MGTDKVEGSEEPDKEAEKPPAPEAEPVEKDKPAKVTRSDDERALQNQPAIPPKPKG